MSRLGTLGLRLIVAPAWELFIYIYMAPSNQDPYKDTILGKFYYDPSDKRLLVISRYTKRYTLNFGNHWSYIITVVVIAGVVLSILGKLGIIR